MPFVEPLPGDSDIVIVYRRTHQQRGIDVFRGETDDRMPDDEYADVRETKAIKLYQNVRRLNTLIGDPLDVGELLPPVGAYGPAGDKLSDTGPLPDPAQFFVFGVKDP